MNDSPSAPSSATVRSVLVASILLLVASIPLGGAALGQPASPGPEPLNPICELAFRQALDQLSADAGAELQSPEVSPSLAPPLELERGSAALDPAIRSCSGLDEFLAAAALYPELFGDADPRVLIASRCWDRDAELAAYATCESFERSLATPEPVPPPTTVPTPQPTPGPTARAKTVPTQEPTRTTSEPRPAAADDGLTRVPRGFRAKVRGANRTRYFEVRGRSPDALLTSAARRARRHCGGSGPIACVQTRTQVATLRRTDPSSGKCTVTSVDKSLSTTAYIPRWTSPKRAPRYVVWWWKKTAGRVGWHEAQHVKIAKTHMRKLPRLVGRPCRRANKLIKRWHADLARAQEAFDELDYPRGDAASARWLEQAYRRFGP